MISTGGNLFEATMSAVPAGNRNKLAAAYCLEHYRAPTAEFDSAGGFNIVEYKIRVTAVVYRTFLMRRRSTA